MKISYHKPDTELGEYVPGLSLLENSGSLSGDISDLDLVNDTWDY